MSIKERLQEDLKIAMKAKEAEKVLVIRGLIAEIKNAEVAPGAKLPIPEPEVIALLKRALKRRRESIEAFRKGNREDLAQKEEAEMVHIQHYLPQEMGEEEVQKIVKETLAELKITNPKDQGLVMKTIMGKYGSQVDGKTVSRLVGEALRS